MEAVDVAHDMNVLVAFLGRRDVLTLTQAALEVRYGFGRADVMALFGGSILAGGDVLARAMRAGVARTYVRDCCGWCGTYHADVSRARAAALSRLDFVDDAPEAEAFVPLVRMGFMMTRSVSGVGLPERNRV